MQIWCLTQEWGPRVQKRRKTQENFKSCFFNTLVTIWYQLIAAIRPFQYYNQPFWKTFRRIPSFRSTLDGAPWLLWWEIFEMTIGYKHYGSIWSARNIEHWHIGTGIIFPLHFSDFSTGFWQIALKSENLPRRPHSGAILQGTSFEIL